MEAFNKEKRVGYSEFTLFWKCRDNVDKPKSVTLSEPISCNVRAGIQIMDAKYIYLEANKTMLNIKHEMYKLSRSENSGRYLIDE